MTAKQAESVNRVNKYSDAFKAFICTDWAPYSDALPVALPATGPAARRRAALRKTITKTAFTRVTARTGLPLWSSA